MTLDNQVETELFREGPDCISREQAVALIDLLNRIYRIVGEKKAYRNQGVKLLFNSPIHFEEGVNRLDFQPPQGSSEAGHLALAQEESEWRLDFTGKGKRVVFTSARLLPKKQVAELLNQFAAKRLNEVSPDKTDLRDELLREISDFVSQLSGEENTGSAQNWGDYPKRSETTTLREKMSHTAEAVTQIWNRAMGRGDARDQELEALRRKNQALEAQVQLHGRRTVLMGALSAFSTLTGAAGVLATAGTALAVGGVVYYKSQEEKMPDYEDVVSDGGNERRIDRLKVPSGISDAGLIFYASAPVNSELAVDTLLSNYEVSRSFFNGQLLGLEVAENVEYRGRRIPRAYHFTIPSPLHGEVMSGKEEEDRMKAVSLPDVLNFLMETPARSDQEIIEWLLWWYGQTFRTIERTALELDARAFTIERFENGMIKDVFYQGSEGQHITVNQLRLLEEIPATSSQARRDYEHKAKPLTDSNGRLLIWTGVNQDIVIPEHLLRPAENFEFNLELEDSTLRVTGKDVVENIRDYLNVRDRGERITIPLYGGQHIRVLGHNHFMNPNDRVVKQIIEEVTDPEMDLCVKANALREFWQNNTDYIDEHGVEVNRPMLFTLMKGGGDCNNLTVGAGTLYAAAGLDVATVFADTDPEKIEGKAPEVFSAHTLNALNLDQLGEGCRVGPDVWTIPNQSGKEIPWILSEPQLNSKFGEFELGRELTPRNIQVFDPKTRNLSAN